MSRYNSTPRARAVPSGRLSRLARLGSMTTGVAGGMALNGLRQLANGEQPSFRDLLLTPGNVRRIADDLARMRGAAMKMGQLLSMESGDFLPPELADILARLRADADFMPPQQLKRVLNEAWGEGWLRQFHRFDVRPIAAASIGQVHRAQLKDGRDVAIKVQYPGVANSIDSDVANVGSLMKLSGLVPKGLELEPYLVEAGRQLQEEADYLREAECLKTFRKLLAGEKDFILPDLHADLTTSTVLVMSFVAGQPIESVMDADQEARDRVARLLIRLMLRELFEFGSMQTDPNFANYRYDPQTGRIVLLDFGAVRHFGPEIRAQYAQMMLAGLSGDRAGLDTVLEQLGFVAISTPPNHRSQVLDMIETVFREVTGPEVYDFANPTLQRALNEAGLRLAEDEFVPPTVPMDALYLQRKFGGTFLLANRLRARVAVRAILESFAPKPVMSR